MPRSSRHKSHRQHRDRSSRDGRDRSDSEEDGDSIDRRARVEEVVEVSTKSRVSKEPESERRQSSGKIAFGSGDGEFVVEHGKKRKDRGGDSDRWNGGDEGGMIAETSLKREEAEDVEVQKSAKSTKVLSVESVSRSSRRREGSVERNEGSGGKWQSEKDSSRRESSRHDRETRETREREKERRLVEDISRKDSSNLYKDDKERDRKRWLEEDSGRRESSQHKDMEDRDRERRSEEDSGRKESSSRIKDAKDSDRERRSEREGRNVSDGRCQRSDDVSSSKRGSSKDQQKDIENAEWQIRDDLRNPELEKELEKRLRRRDGSGDKDKWIGDERDVDDKRLSRDDQLSSRDDRARNGSYKDERHRSERYKDKHREDIDKDQRHDGKYRDRHSSKDYASDRSDNKYYKEDNIVSDGCYKKSKLQDNDQDGSPCVNEHGTKYKDHRGRKRSLDENEDYGDPELRNVKELRGDHERTASSKVDHTDAPRSDYSRSDKVESNLRNNRHKSSPSSSAYGGKDRSRHISKQTDSSFRGSPSGERFRSGTASTDHGNFSAGRSRDSDPRSLERIRPKDDVSSLEIVETVAASLYDRTPRSPSTSDRRLSDRVGPGVKPEMEKGGRTGSVKDGRDYSNVDNRGRELPTHLPPPPSGRLGIDGSSVLGSYDSDNRGQIGDRKSNSRYKRSVDSIMGRSQGNAWKGNQTWPSPVANGFMPFQHGPPPSGFHPSVQQFPAQPLFGVRPPMDLNHSGVPYDIHDAADRFSGHVRPFGWRNPMDDSCPPHLQVWDGSNGIFSDESHVYGRSEWDQNRHVIGSRGWELNADIWKGQNGNINMGFSVPQESEHQAHSLADEGWAGQSVNQLSIERTQPEPPPSEGIGTARSNDTPLVRTSVGTSQKLLPETEGTPESSKSPGAPQSSKASNHDMHLCCSYLSKLDISLDLVRPELYEQCMSLLENNNRSSEAEIPKHLNFEDNKEKASSSILNALFPKATDSIFQRALSLYKKQTERMKIKSVATPLACLEDVEDPANVPDAEKVEVGCDQISPDAGEALDAEKVEVGCGQNSSASEKVLDAEKIEVGCDQASPNTEKDLDTEGCLTVNKLDAGNNQTSAGEPLTENTKSTVEFEGEKNASAGIEGVLTCNLNEQPSSINPDAVVLVEGSQNPCEALMEECRVNLNRIPNSPESTH